jgi:hypothetical protein
MVAKFSKAIQRAQENKLIDKDISTEDAARFIVASAYTITQLKFTVQRRKSVECFIDHVIKLALHPR